MLTVTLTSRSVDNQATGIDITVPSVKETEAPLGYSSVEYDIHVVTRLVCFKTDKLKETDVVEFVVSKTYREVQDLYEKLKKHFRSLKFPQFATAMGVGDVENVRERKKTLENLMGFLSQHANVCTSPIFLQFLGLDPKNPSQSIRVDVDSPSPAAATSDDENCSEDEERDGIFKKVKLKKEKDVLKDSTQETNSTPELEDVPKEIKLPKLTDPSDSLFASDKFAATYEVEDDDYEDLFIAASKSKESSSNKNLRAENSTPSKARISLFGDQDYGGKLSKEDSGLFGSLVNCEPDEDFLFQSQRKTTSSQKREEEKLLQVDNCGVEKELEGIFGNSDDFLNLDSVVPGGDSARSKAPSSTTTSIQTRSQQKDANANPTAPDGPPLPSKPIPKPRSKLPAKPPPNNESNTTLFASPVPQNPPPQNACKPPPPPKPRTLSSAGRPTPPPKPRTKSAPSTGGGETSDAGRRQVALQNGSQKIRNPGATPTSDDVDILKYIEDHQNRNESTDIKLFD